MDFKILTHEGFTIDINKGPEVQSFADQLNNRTLFTLPLAGMVIAKNLFKMVIPAGELTGDYEVHTADGEVYLTDIDGYSAESLSAAFNDPRLDFIRIGDLIIQRQNFKMIRMAAVA